MVDVTEVKKELVATAEEVSEAYMDGVKAAREFDESMDMFLVNFLRKPYSSIVIFTIAAGLLAGGIFIGATL